MAIDRDKERDIATLIKKDEKRAARDIYGVYAGYVAGICARYLSSADDIKDVVQDSFVKIFVSVGKFRYSLRSDISYGYSDSPLFKASQNLHFLGIPVNVRYTPWSFKKLDIYASAGVMAEKCISGHIKTANPQAPEYSYTGCDGRPFQFSVNAAAGLRYSLAGSCAVFIEPGIGLYLKNGSRLRTIYSERPLTFNVNIGLRFRHP